MSKRKNVPEIRFKGFNNAWEQRKFRDFIFKAGEKNTLDKNYPAYSVSNKLGLVSQTEQFDGSRLDNLDKTSYKLVNPNEFAYNPARINVGSIAFNNFNKTVIVSSLYVVFKISEKLDNEFILQFIKSQSFINEVKRNTEGSVREYLFFENFRNIKFPYTSKNEQVRIGKFFKQLDNTIALYQQKLDKVKEFKKVYLDEIFNQKVRFSDSSDQWEQRRLDSLVERIKSYPLSRDVETSEYTGYKYIHYGDIHTKVAGVIDNSSNLPNINAGNFELLEKGDIVLADASEDYQGIATPAIITIEPPYNLVSGLHTIALRPKQVNSLFLYYLFSSPVFRKFGYKTGTGMKVFGISVKNLLKFETLFPSLEEQAKIANFLKQLDDIITLQEKKLSKLNELKKAYLQKMFI